MNVHNNSTQHHHHDGLWGKYKELIFSLITGILWLIAFILSYYSISISKILLLGAYVFGGYELSKDFFKSLSKRRVNIESLMIFAAIGTLWLGHLNEGALLLFLFSLGHSLEHFALNKAKSSIKSLTDLSPKTAFIKNSNILEVGGLLNEYSVTEVLVDQLAIGQIVVVKPGQIIPCDGIIRHGKSNVNQSTITGESIPVEKFEGEEVFASTTNGYGLLEIEVTKLSLDTMFAKIIRLISSTDTQKSNAQRFSEKFERVFVPIVIVMVLLITFIPPMFGLMTFKNSIYLALVTLVSASPCALAIATPVAVLIGISKMAKLGVLIKGGIFLENLGNLRAIAFDKTGTLTYGNPSLESVITLSNHTKNELLSLAYGLEISSAHPLAHTIIEYCKKNDIKKSDVTDVKSITGKGMIGDYKNQVLKLGNAKMFDKLPIDVSTKVNNLQQIGITTMIISLGDEIIGVIGISDRVRDNIKNMLLQLKQSGLERSVMLTGDSYLVANSINKNLMLDEVVAQLMPEDKLIQIKKLTQKYKVTAMVGDGVNDTLALKSATIGIAMGGTKTDVAIDVADIVLMNDQIDRLPEAVNFSKKVNKIIKQNLFISLAIVVLLVIGGLCSVTNMVFAVGIHEGSTLVVIFNALRLLYNNRSFNGNSYLN